MNTHNQCSVVFLPPCDNCMNKPIYSIFKYCYMILLYHVLFCSYENVILYDYCIDIPINIKKSYEIS